MIDLYTKFNHILFNDEDHSYINTITGNRYISGTSFIKKFTKPYDSGYYAERKSNKTGVPIEAIIKQWKLSGDLGKTKGTLIHKYNEDLWQNKVFNIKHPSWILNIPTIEASKYLKNLDILLKYSKNYWNDYKDILIPIKLEPVIGDDEWNIATMVDKIVYDINNKYFGIVDYKTDKEINFVSKYGNRFLEPISHLSECEINKYSIQTEISKRILEKHCNIEISFRKIVWYNVENTNYKIIDCLDVSKEVDLMLECYG
jgi:hypothetical protein